MKMFVLAAAMMLVPVAAHAEDVTAGAAVFRQFTA